MNYILWMLLNTCLGFFVLYIIYRLTKVAYIKAGSIGAITIVLIIITIICKPVKSNNNLQTKTWNFKTADSVRWFRSGYFIAIENNPVFNIQLDVTSLSDKNRLVQEPLKASTQITGIVGGNDWIPQNILLTAKNDSFYYIVSGRLDWKLLGITVFTQQKNFRGEFKKI